MLLRRPKSLERAVPIPSPSPSSSREGSDNSQVIASFVFRFLFFYYFLFWPLDPLFVFYHMHRLTNKLGLSRTSCCQLIRGSWPWHFAQTHRYAWLLMAFFNTSLVPPLTSCLSSFKLSASASDSLAHCRLARRPSPYATCLQNPYQREKAHGQEGGSNKEDGDLRSRFSPCRSLCWMPLQRPREPQ